MAVDPEFFDDISVAVMQIVEGLRTRKLAGDVPTVEEIAESLLDPKYGAQKISAGDHRKALAVMAATAINWLVYDGGFSIRKQQEEPTDKPSE
jgi:hypothetical protein